MPRSPRRYLDAAAGSGEIRLAAPRTAAARRRPSAGGTDGPTRPSRPSRSWRRAEARARGGATRRGRSKFVRHPVWRTDIQNLPQWSVRPARRGYGLLTAAFSRAPDLRIPARAYRLRCHAGDSTASGRLASKDLPPASFDPVGVEFVTGPFVTGLFEVAEQTIPRNDPLRPLYLHDRLTAPSRRWDQHDRFHGARVRAGQQRHLTRAGDEHRRRTAPEVRRPRRPWVRDRGHRRPPRPVFPVPPNPAARRTADRSATGSSTASHAGRGASGRGSISKLSKGRRHWRRRQTEAADPAISRLVSCAGQNLRPRPAVTCERLPSITRAASGLAKSRSL